MFVLSCRDRRKRCVPSSPLLLLLTAAMGCEAVPRRSDESPSARADSPSCYMLALGPAASSDEPPVRTPAVFELRPAGRIAVARASDDTLVASDSLLGYWWQPSPDSVRLVWFPSLLSGSLDLRLASSGDTLRGRYG